LAAISPVTITEAADAVLRVSGILDRLETAEALVDFMSDPGEDFASTFAWVDPAGEAECRRLTDAYAAARKETP
jgi:hypothetical protein